MDRRNFFKFLGKSAVGLVVSAPVLATIPVLAEGEVEPPTNGKNGLQVVNVINKTSKTIKATAKILSIRSDPSQKQYIEYRSNIPVEGFIEKPCIMFPVDETSRVTLLFESNGDVYQYHINPYFDDDGSIIEMTYEIGL